MCSRDENPERISSENMYGTSVSGISRKFQGYQFSH